VYALIGFKENAPVETNVISSINQCAKVSKAVTALTGISADSYTQRAEQPALHHKKPMTRENPKRKGTRANRKRTRRSNNKKVLQFSMVALT
jgi:hypothetical protein